MALESFGEGVVDTLTTDIPGLGVDLLYIGGVAAVIFGGIWIARKAFENAFK